MPRYFHVSYFDISNSISFKPSNKSYNLSTFSLRNCRRIYFYRPQITAAMTYSIVSHKIKENENILLAIAFVFGSLNAIDSK